MFLFDYFLKLKRDLDTSNDTSRTLSRTVDAKIAELKALSDAVANFGRNLGIEDIPSGGSPQSHMLALHGHVWSELREAVYIEVKRALAVVASHYEIGLEWVCEGYILPDEDDLAEAEVRRLTDIIEGLGLALARHFEKEVASPVSPASVGSYSAAMPPNDAKGAASPLLLHELLALWGCNKHLILLCILHAETFRICSYVVLLFRCALFLLFCAHCPILLWSSYQNASYRLKRRIVSGETES